MQSIDCDIVIVGAGAAGGVLAATLSELTNARIVLLEKGGYFTKDAFTQRGMDTGFLYAEEGRRTASDGGIAVRGGECVGGGTPVNVALCFDPVERVWDSSKHDLGLEAFSFDTSATDYGKDALNIPSIVSEI